MTGGGGARVGEGLAYLELVRLAFLGEDVWLEAVSGHEPLLQTGQLGEDQLKGFSEVLGP